MQAETNDTKEILQRLDHLTKQVDYLAAQQRRTAELIDEVVPIAKEAMGVASSKLSDWESKGYVAFGRELFGIGEEIVTNFSVEDAHMLRESTVTLLNLVKRMTRPRMLALASSVTNVVETEPHSTGLLGMIKASNDHDTRRGVATALAILKEIGRTVSTASEQRLLGSEKLARHLAPSNLTTKSKTATPKPKTGSPQVHFPSRPANGPTVTAADRCEPSGIVSKSPVSTLPGWVLDGEGFLADPTLWARDFSVQMAAAVNIPTLTPEHWMVIEFARAEYIRSGKSPNVRLLASGSGVSTKAVYSLFLKAPGMTAARISGVPKPVGCI